jgi:hypothetical protein
MPSLWDAVFIQVLDRTGPLILNLSGTPYMCLCNEFPQGGFDFQIFSVGLPIRSPCLMNHKKRDFEIGRLKMPKKSHLMDASPVLRCKFPEDELDSANEPMKSFSIQISVRSNPFHSSGEKRTLVLTERASTARTLRSYFSGECNELSFKHEFFAEFRSNPSDPDGQTRLAIATPSISEKAEESWF